MEDNSIYQPSEAELEILQVIWDIEPTNVRAVYERIAAAGKEVGYTTVLKQVQRLTEKGALVKTVIGGTHLYRAAAQESEVKGQLAGKVLRNTFGGSALQMMMHALGNEKASAEELTELKNWLDTQIPKK